MRNIKTKKIIGFFALAVMLTAVGCKDKAVEKEVIVMPGTTTVIEKEVAPAAPDSTTSISLDKNGLKVDAQKVNVRIGE